MDDVLLLSHDDEPTTLRLIALLEHCFQTFGIAVNYTKSVLVPSTSIEFLGFVVAVSGSLSVTAARQLKLR
jgi:hypothetical protein